jgi:hypothetical protein
MPLEEPARRRDAQDPNVRSADHVAPTPAPRSAGSATVSHAMVRALLQATRPVALFDGAGKPQRVGRALRLLLERDPAPAGIRARLLAFARAAARERAAARIRPLRPRDPTIAPLEPQPAASPHEFAHHWIDRDLFGRGEALLVIVERR